MFSTVTFFLTPTYVYHHTETTAHSMGFMLACLALWPEVQDKVHKNIMQVMGTGEPTVSD